jgi:uncharacterized phiE125 gp8 family phage protein
MAEPITLAEALLHLRETADGGANDAYITGLISVAREACEDRTERTLITTPWLLRLDGFPSAIRLMQPPVIAVQSLNYDDEDGVEQTLSQLDYVLDPASEPGYLVPAPSASWPATQAGAINTVRVAYTAGYGDTSASVPAPLRHWIKLALTDLYETRSASAERPAVAHNFADALLQPYRMLGV